MRRRAILAASGAVLASVAGCTSGGDSTPTPTTGTGAGRTTSTGTRTDTSYPTPDYPVGTGDLETFDPATTAEAVSVGSRAGVADPENNGPHHLRIWNAAPAARDVEVRITDFVDGSTVLDRRFDVPGDAAIVATLEEPSSYVCSIRVAGGATGQTLSVPRSYFDCNRSETRIGVFEDGSVRSVVISTALLCSTATDEG